MSRLRRYLCLHYFKPSLYRLFDVRERLIICFALRKAAGQSRDLCYVVTGFIFFYVDMQFQITPPNTSQFILALSP